jgi:hypothetical protein
LGIARALSKKAKGKPVTSIEALFYLMVKVLFGGVKKKNLERNDVSLLKIATRADLWRHFGVRLCEFRKPPFKCHIAIVL